MKTLILYMSHHGTTEKVAEKISSLLGYNTAKVVNLRTSKPPSLSDFDKVIIGGSVHMGRIQPKITQWCEDNLHSLLSKKVGLFICCLDKEHEQEEFERSYPPALVEHAEVSSIFGGELLFERMNFVEKVVAKTVAKEQKSMHRLDQQAINYFSIVMGN